MMNYLKILIVFIVSLSSFPVNGQHTIEPVEGYSTQIGIMVDMLEEIKDRIVADTRNLTQEETDYEFDDKANSIGALIMHIAATESYFQVETLEERQWTEEEGNFWGIASGLGPESKQKLKGKPIQYYLDLWNEVRKKTLEGLRNKNDEWFAENVDENVNNHWAWFHILEHQTGHMGQISLAKARFPE